MDPRTWTDAECLRVASKFYYGGMALLPLLWVVNVVYFRHVVRRQNPPPDPKLVRIVRNSLGLAVLGLAVVWPAWLAALVVGVALLVAVGVAALTGRSQVQQAPPPLQESAQSVQQDLEAVKGARRG